MSYYLFDANGFIADGPSVQGLGDFAQWADGQMPLRLFVEKGYARITPSFLQALRVPASGSVETSRVEILHAADRAMDVLILSDGMEQRKELSELMVLGGKGSGNYGHAGRPGVEGGSAASGFAGAPMTGTGGAAWRKKQQKRYDEDANFRAAVDAITLFTQGSFDPIRAASIAAAGGEKTLRKHYQDWLDRPLTVAASPLNSYKNYFEGQDVEGQEEGMLTRRHATLREAGKALNDAIDSSPRLSESIYRGMHVPHVVSKRKSDEIDPNSGRIYATKDRDQSPTVDVPNPLLRRIATMKPGDEYELPGATSFTADRQIAQDFSRGEAVGQSGRRSGNERRHVPAVVLEVRKARAIAAAALSPWKQKEVLTRGKFKVVSVERTPIRPDSSINDYHVVLEAL